MSILYSKEINSTKSLVIRKVSWWESHHLNIKYYYKFGWSQRPSKLHCNLQFLLFGFQKFNGGCVFRLGNISLTYLWS